MNAVLAWITMSTMNRKSTTLLIANRMRLGVVSIRVVKNPSSNGVTTATNTSSTAVITSHFLEKSPSGSMIPPESSRSASVSRRPLITASGLPSLSHAFLAAPTLFFLSYNSQS